MSGARDDRPGLADLMDYVREGDTVVVWKLDRLGRNTLDILETVKALTDRRVTLAALACGSSVTNNESPQPAVVRP
ncbi:MAG TPA: recombinase family protein [Mycobacterium sp.]|jgi:DNA invertase Pin-like site-specific DNA recombinase